MVFDLFHRSGGNKSLFAQTIARFRGGRWRRKPQAGRRAAAGEPALTEPCFEGMETRLLLDVSPVDYGLIRAMYPDLKLPASMAEYNLIEILAGDLSAAALRGAIATAGGTPQSDLIVVRTNAVENTITLGGAELTISINAKTHGSVIIVSLSDDPLAATVPLTIDAQNDSRGFTIGSGANVSLGGLKVTKGGNVSDGGGIYNAGTLRLANCTISVNVVRGDLETSVSRGGGIYNSGTLTVVHSVVSGNTAGRGGGSARDGIGGGIYNHTSGTLTVTSSFLEGNVNYIGGNAGDSGGIYDNASSGTTRIVNSFLCNANTGAIYHNGGATMRVTNCTIWWNNFGIVTTKGIVYVENSIITENYPTSHNIIRVNANANLYGYNNITTFTGWTRGDGNIVSNAKAFESTTYQPGPDSPARDAGSNTYASNAGLTSGSRDVAGGSRIVGGRIDIGAGEYQGAATADPVPAVMAVSNVGWQSVVLSWASVAGAAEYVVEWSVKGASVPAGSTTVPGGGSAMATEIAGLQTGTAYTFRVYAVLSAGMRKSANYASASETTKAVPSPRSVKAKADGATAIVVTWQPPKEAPPAGLALIGYAVYSTSDDSAPLGGVGTEVFAFRVENLLPNTSYSYRVAAVYQVVGEDAVVESTKSVTVKTKTKKFVAPKAVKTVAGDLGLSSATIRWQPHGDADGFAVTCSTKKVPVLLDFDSETGNASFVYDNSDRIVGVTVRGLLPGTKYDFVVCGTMSSTGASSSAMKKSVTTVKFVAPKAAKVFASLGLTSATVHWQPHSHADGGYVITWYDAKDKKLTHPLGSEPVTAEATSYTIPDLLPGTKYTVIVQAVNTSVAVPSAVLKKSVTTLKFPAAQKPTALKPQLTSTSSGLTWKATVPPQNVTGSVTYELYYTETKGLKPGAAGWTPIPLAGEGEGVTATFTAATAATIAGLEPDKTYYVYLRAIWDQDDSVFSNSPVLTLKTPR